VRYIRVCPLVWILVVAALLSAQAGPRQTIAQALALERDGRPAQAIVALRALLDSKSLDPPGTGQAWNILGLSYKDQGNFAYAQHAFEQSIRILEGLPNNTREYGMALDNFGGLLFAMGQPEPAGRIKEKAVHVYEKTNDHTGLAIAYSDLAGLAFSQKQMRRGRTYMERARQEAQLANDLDDDNLAAISSMQGWLALLDGDVVATVSAYQHSLDLWRRRHGEEHPSTGWGYMLLGDAKAEGGELTSALVDMQRGLAVLDRTLGRQNTRYLTAEIAYSRVLDRTGAHTEATRMKTDAERDLNNLHRTQCVACTVSAAAFR
jgi:tetratricopeptide (TPR) repeat protein